MRHSGTLGQAALDLATAAEALRVARYRPACPHGNALLKH
jgi:hypothetical protein